MQPIPKKEYMRLSPAAKRAVSQAVKGKGAYKNFVRKSSRGAYKNFVRGRGAYRGRGGLIDDILGVGKDIGSAALNAGLRGGKKLLGFGAYSDRPMSAPSNMSITAAPPGVPSMSSSARKNQFTYREYLGDVMSSVDFANTVFNINPGLGDPGSEISTCAGLFPWLSNMAASNYEQYRVDQAMLEFISTSSDAVVSGATTSSLGQVCLATQYNTNSPGFTNLTDALNSQFATTEKPSVNFCHVIECAPREKAQNVQYIRSGPLAMGQDILQYDMGQVNLITQGMPAAGEVIGQLWITYKVSLFKPILLQQGLSQSVQYAHYQYTNSNSDVTTSHYWGTNAANMVATTGSNMKFTFSISTNELIWPSDISLGHYQVTICFTGASTALTNPIPTPTMSPGIALVNLFDGNTISHLQVPGGATGVFQYQTGFVNVTALGANMTWGTSATLPTSITYVDVIVTQVNTNANGLALERKFGNFWRPKKGAATAPWLRGKQTGDRRELPAPQPFDMRRYIEYLAESDAKSRRLEKKERELKHIHDIAIREEEEEDDGLELTPGELDLVLRLRKSKQTAKDADDYVKVQQETPKKSQSLKA